MRMAGWEIRIAFGNLSYALVATTILIVLFATFVLTHANKHIDCSWWNPCRHLWRAALFSAIETFCDALQERGRQLRRPLYATRTPLPTSRERYPATFRQNVSLLAKLCHAIRCAAINHRAGGEQDAAAMRGWRPNADQLEGFPRHWPAI